MQQPLMTHPHAIPPHSMPMMFAQNHMSRIDTCLYVGNLSPLITEEMLFTDFSVFGLLVSIRIMKDLYLRESRGFGYVTFADLASAQRAQRELNGKEMFKRELRVHFKINTKNLNQEVNFVIKNIAKNISSRQLIQECTHFGDVVSCFVKKEENKEGVMEHLGYGYVQFEKLEDGNRFFAEFNDRELNGKKVLVERFVPSNIREKAECSNLYIKQFPKSWNKERIDQFLTTEFESCGEITSIGVFESKANSFYAFVAFGKGSSAELAITKFDKMPLEEAVLHVCQALTKGKRKIVLEKERLANPQHTNIFIKSIKLGVTQEQVTNVFKKYGDITSTFLKTCFILAPRNQMPFNPTAQPVISPQQLQFGFVNFLNDESAQKALSEYKKDPELKELVSHEGDGQFVFMAQTKIQRREFLKMQTRMRGSYKANSAMVSGYNQRSQNPRHHHKKPYQQGGNLQEGGNLRQGPHNQNNQQMTLDSHGNQQQNTLISTLTNKQTETMNVFTDYKQVAENLRNTREEFLEKPIDEQKNYLGNIMYARVRSMTKDESLIPKITGMLIDMEVLEFEEILEIIENDNSLKERIDEAIEVIKDNNDDEEEKNQKN